MNFSLSQTCVYIFLVVVCMFYMNCDKNTKHLGNHALPYLTYLNQVTHKCVSTTYQHRLRQRLVSCLALNQWASYQIRKIAGCACAGNAGNGFARRRFQRKLLVSDPGMHHGTCVTHMPWCMPGSPTCGDGENVPGIPGTCAPAILRIWQEAHASMLSIGPK